ncbi:MAG: hypothetical protein NWT08_01325 [Akkermansiaceae bacterium]|nr:hypothetical protein [Akkermansiaceae bacterium]MDP4719896.1 hypothetical protein [Akkermansiaceae bacterium]MDP4778757.1 hypothetical protein [Akkermansiaceae bacterium]MDP4847040.1 hypothetical protein [Akkermansiaceae bacterium]
MATAVHRPQNDEARLWAVAICISVLLNLVFLAWISIEAIKSEIARKIAIPEAAPPEQTVIIYPNLLELVPETPAEEAKPKVVRTSPDQEVSDPAASRRYIGERNTEATSDRAPTSDEDMPSQAGREARPEENPETTVSEYQDGSLTPKQNTPPSPKAETSEPAPPSEEQTPAEMTKGLDTEDPGEDEEAQTAIREKLLDGPNPIDTPVPEALVSEDLPPREEMKPTEGEKDAIAEEKTEDSTEPKPKPAPAPIEDPAFAGNQTKTAIQGNISRNGRSSLDVSDTAMGRYQSQISRAVELEWQRNCVRHRDYITPGYLTVRFFVEQDGRVKTVQFVGDSQTGEVQKGFTLNSIRNAEIPAMPSAVKKEMGGDALELIFNFYF